MNRINLNAFVQQAMANQNMMINPTFSNAVNMFRTRNSKSLHEIAENACHESGTTYEEMKKKLGY